MSRIRSFVGIPVPDALLDGYRAAQRALGSLQGVKWVERKNLHLTLKFLGSVEAGALPAICSALARTAAGHEPATLTASGLSAFPRPAAAGVLVVELEDPSGTIVSLGQAVESVLAPLGIPREGRRFSPHVTLGRCRERKVDATAVLAAAPVPGGSWRVERVELIESRLGPHGSSYSPLETFELALPRHPEC